MVGVGGVPDNTREKDMIPPLLALALTSTASAGLLDGGGKEVCYGIAFDGMCLTDVTAASQLDLGADDLLFLKQCEDEDGVAREGCIQLSVRERDGDLFTYTLYDDPCVPVLPTDGSRVYKACYADYTATWRIRYRIDAAYDSGNFRWTIELEERKQRAVDYSWRRRDVVDSTFTASD